MCLILVIKIKISITGFMRGIYLFRRKLIIRQDYFCETEQKMPKYLDRRDYEANERIVSCRERIPHIFSLLISVCIIVWIHMENVPWSRNIISGISKEVKKLVIDKQVVVGLSVIVGCIIIMFWVYVSLSLKRKRNLNVLHHTIVQSSKVYELLMSLSTSDFLDKLYEFLVAFKDGQLTMSRELLNKIVILRSDRLCSNYARVSKEIVNQQKKIGKCIANLSCFITSKIVDAKLGRKRIKKLLPHFKHVASKLLKYSSQPRDFFTVDKSIGNSPFDEVQELLTTVLKWAGVKKPLRMEAISLITEMEINWQNLLLLEARQKQLESEVKEWKSFAEENIELIDEVLDDKDFYYEDWS